MTPYIGFSNDTLGKCEPLAAGAEIACSTCKGRHVVTASGPLLFYSCGAESYLAGVNGRSVMGVKADVAGKM